MQNEFHVILELGENEMLEIIKTQNLMHKNENGLIRVLQKSKNFAQIQRVLKIE